MNRWYARPVFFVADLTRALRFYESLGFLKGWHEADGAGTVCQVNRSECEIILSEDAGRRDRARLFVELTPDGLADLRREIAAHSIPSSEARWGYDVIRVEDPDGNELLFPYEQGHDMRSRAPLPPTQLPEREAEKSHGTGPPRPPRFWRGGGGSGRGPWWLFLIGALILALMAFQGIQMYRLFSRASWSALSFALGAIATLIRSRRSSFNASDDTGQDSLPWALGAGMIGFLVAHLISGAPGWEMLILGTVGLGGALGLAGWIVASALIATIAGVREFLRWRRRW